VVDGKEFKESSGGLLMMPLTSSFVGTGGVGGSGSGSDLAALPTGKHTGYVAVKVRVTDPTVTALLAPPAAFRRPQWPVRPPPSPMLQLQRPSRGAFDARAWAQAQRDAEKAAALVAAEAAERQAALAAEQKADRDARYAARKAAKKVRRRGY
jgi:hypothetical protein